jgi:hypothetical protein
VTRLSGEVEALGPKVEAQLAAHETEKNAVAALRARVAEARVEGGTRAAHARAAYDELVALRRLAVAHGVVSDGAMDDGALPALMAQLPPAASPATDARYAGFG